MRIIGLFAAMAWLFIACDDSRVYEKNEDFDDRAWVDTVKPEFEFQITDTLQRYNIYCNIRNSVSYPYSRLFVTYYLQDSAGKVQQTKLIDHLLFDPKTGEPHGTSGLGDIYDHRALMIQSHRFPYIGKHKIRLEQFMRADTLSGIMAVGIRVERAQ
jgi:gliding motility-associated lipoprotein GldH